MEIKFINFNNVGFLEQKLPKEVLKRLRQYIKNKKHKINNELAGNIDSSYDLEDKENWFFKNILIPNTIEFENKFNKSTVVDSILTKNWAYVLNTFWVNFQKKYEFNPVHNHQGIYSFVIWMDIPADYEEEKKLPFVNNSNSPFSNTFQFLYTNSFGQISTHQYHLSPKNEGTMLFFHSKTIHTVYPFYTSNKTRVSISGNISLDPNQVVDKHGL
jgi:hypothetical protein